MRVSIGVTVKLRITLLHCGPAHNEFNSIAHPLTISSILWIFSLVVSGTQCNSLCTLNEKHTDIQTAIFWVWWQQTKLFTLYQFLAKWVLGPLKFCILQYKIISVGISATVQISLHVNKALLYSPWIWWWSPAWLSSRRVRRWYPIPYPAYHTWVSPEASESGSRLLTRLKW